MEHPCQPGFNNSLGGADCLHGEKNIDITDRINYIKGIQRNREKLL